MAWHREGGADWNLKIAEDQLLRWIEEAIVLVPNSKYAILANLGDFLHFDGLIPVTPTNAHVLDAAGRFQEIVAAATRILRKVIDRLLEKHELLHVLMLEGNHDLASSVWLREMFFNLYENEPRISVERSPRPYYCVEFGETSLFFHHGHLTNMTRLSEAFASTFRPVFGRTKFSYGHTGHRHHAQVIETSLMIIEQHQTLVAKDSHTSRHAYNSQRAAQVITYDKNGGESNRVRIKSHEYNTPKECEAEHKTFI
jgi:hypothetical protein